MNVSSVFVLYAYVLTLFTYSKNSFWMLDHFVEFPDFILFVPVLAYWYWLKCKNFPEGYIIDWISKFEDEVKIVSVGLNDIGFGVIISKECWEKIC